MRPQGNLVHRSWPWCGKNRRKGVRVALTARFSRGVFMKTVSAGILLGLVLATVPGAAQDKKSEGKSDEELIQGVWKVVSSEDGGKVDEGTKDLLLILSRS